MHGINYIEHRISCPEHSHHKTFITAALFCVWVAGASAESIKIVALGGSNTFGKNLSRSAAYPAQLETMLKGKGYDVVVVNEGTNGQTTYDELGKLDTVVTVDTKIVIFQPGGNDRRKGKSGTKSNIQTIIEKLQERKILVLFSGGEGKQRAVEQFNIQMIDEINKLAPDDLQPDGEHLTARGYSLAAEKMLPAVQSLIEQIKAR